jgi:anti-sigma factor RsiW
MKKIDCYTVRSRLADLMLDPGTVPAEVQAHAAECHNCANELAELRSTMDMLDTWMAPEPSPYFLTRLEARMREEREKEPAGWLARIRTSFRWGQGGHTRPVAAMALTVLLVIGGGTYLGLSNWNHPKQPQTQAAVIEDLQTMDSNAQVLDRLESLSSEDAN